MQITAGSVGEESSCGPGDASSIPGLGRFSWRTKGQLIPVLLPEKKKKKTWTQEPVGLHSDSNEARRSREVWVVWLLSHLCLCLAFCTAVPKRWQPRLPWRAGRRH